MGVKDLWHILSPLGERKPVYELQGKVIAIDLSCWVVDSQTVTDNIVQPKMYLRNLYFRTMFLLMQGISPVFVLEGEAPTLKHKTIAKRNDIRNGFQERKTNKKGGRTRFNRVLSECQKMLKYMGLACVQGTGEAEAMCAYLNKDGLVDGCISQDSDCFLYGAKVVYRNFTMGSKAKTNTTGTFVDEYNIEKIGTALNLGRNKMIALALLCGCDYDNGITGIGKEAALKFFKLVEDEQVLERIKSWKTDASFDKLEIELTNPKVCTNCGHAGNAKMHGKSGCSECGTFAKCHDTFKDKRALMLNEISLRKKTLEYDNFPNQELINEFLIRKDAMLPKVELRWKQPQVKRLIDFMNDYLAWEPRYAFEKVLPLATRWQLLHLPDISPDKRLSMSYLFVAEKIKKIRNIRCVASYEIIWKDESGLVERIREYEVSDDENNDDILQELATIEPQDMVQKCYPELVEEFESARTSKSKKRTVKSRKNKVNENNEGNSEVDKDELKKRQRKARRSKPNKKIDQFIAKNQVTSLEDSFEQMSITPKRSKKTLTSNRVNTPVVDQENRNPQSSSVNVKRGPQFKRVLEKSGTSKLDNTLNRLLNDLSPEDFLTDAEDNDLDISAAIQRVCSTQVFHFNSQISKPPNRQISCEDIPTKNSRKLAVLGENIIKEHPRLSFSGDINSNKNTDHNAPNNYESEEMSQSSVGNNEHIFQCMNSNNAECIVQQSRDDVESDTLGSETPDEFDTLARNYVPLNQRLQLQRKGESSANVPSRTANKYSLGFDALLNNSSDSDTVL